MFDGNYSVNVEMWCVWTALVLYVIGGSVAVISAVFGKMTERVIGGLLACGFVLHTASLISRWVTLGHGPFVSMYEILSSNIWGLMLAVLIVYWRLPVTRKLAAVVMPVIFIFIGWLLMMHPGESRLPATFNTVWLYVHVGFAKVFFGSALLAASVAGAVLLRSQPWLRTKLASLPDDSRLGELAFRFLALAIIFDSLMLVAGAIWAQDAWGRYWGWDRLETWSFLTWVYLAASIHARYAFKLTPRVWSWLVIGVFVLAVLTFLGIPFVSQSPHKGTF